jgi:alkaline phosphatase D
MDRRRFVRSGVYAAGYAAFGAPAILIQDRDRPSMPQGVASGDVTDGHAVVWSRADRASRMFVEYSTTERFGNALRVPGPAALEPTDFTARVVLSGLPPGQRIFYRVLFQDLLDLRRWSEPASGTFLTPPSAQRPRDVKIAWSADTCGQGWGINPEWGGLRLYETMRRAEPDVFVHCGDTIYADAPIPAEIKLDDGTMWKNIVTPAKSKAAETLDEYRGNYQYNLLDEHMRRFNAATSQIVLWDDHEVRDNWYWERDLSTDDKYKNVKSMPLLAARARQAFFEYNPLRINGDDPVRVQRTIPYGPPAEIFALDLRSYRGANSANRQTVLADDSRIFGASQIERLQARLAASRATWKIIASDMPIGLVVRDGQLYEAIANGDNGVPLGREMELAGLLRFIRNRRIHNVVWITADVHYCAAHLYHPSRAQFTEFAPFWEFVAGPLNAGTFGPGQLDPTFGPEAKFVGIPKGMKGNRPPSEGFQFFGTMTIAARTRAMTVRLHDLTGKTLFSIELPPTSSR